MNPYSGNTAYTVSRHRSNDVVSGLLHLVGALLSVAVMVVLIVLSALEQGASAIIGVTLYGTGLSLLYLASASYHLLSPHHAQAKAILQRIDHAMIYALIAGTYMPVVFIALNGAWRWSVFGIITGLAVIGMTLKLTNIPLPSFLSAGLYAGMGWFALIAYKPLFASLTSLELWLLFLGGIAYSIGIIFFLLEDKLTPRIYFWMHEIFHVFVLLGSALHAIMIFSLVSAIKP